MHMSHVLRKPVYAMGEQQRPRSDCADAYTFYIQSFKAPRSFCSWAGPFESYLVANPKDMFSSDVAHIVVMSP